METTKPIQRSPELTPLSRDHHNGLLTGWKIKAGLRNNTDLKRIAAFVSASYSQELKEHFNQEEQHIFNLLPDGDSMVKTALLQHEQLKMLVVRIENSPEISLLEEFAELLTVHIRFEERELFPFIEQNAPVEMFSQAGEMIAKLHEHQSCMVWTDEFWKSVA